jgi:hypothetical protein
MNFIIFYNSPRSYVASYVNYGSDLHSSEKTSSDSERQISYFKSPLLTNLRGPIKVQKWMAYYFVTEEHEMTVRVSGEFVYVGSAVFSAEEESWWPQSPSIITTADNTESGRLSTRKRNSSH